MYQVGDIVKLQLATEDHEGVDVTVVQVYCDQLNLENAALLSDIEQANADLHEYWTAEQSVRAILARNE